MIQTATLYPHAIQVRPALSPLPRLGVAGRGPTSRRPRPISGRARAQPRPQSQPLDARRGHPSRAARPLGRSIPSGATSLATAARGRPRPSGTAGIPFRAPWGGADGGEGRWGWARHAPAHAEASSPETRCICPSRDPTHAWQVRPPRARHTALLPVACARVRGRAAARGAHLGGGGAAACSDCPGSQLGTHAAHPPHQGPARLLRAASFRPERERPRYGDAKERLRRERPVALAPAQSRRARCLLTSQALQAYRDTSLVSPLPRLWLAAGRRRELRAAGVRSHVRGGGGGRGTGRGAGRARRAGRGGSSVRLQTL